MRKKSTKVERDKVVFWLLSNRDQFADDYASDVWKKCNAALGFCMSKTAVREVLKAHDIPYRQGTFCGGENVSIDVLDHLEDLVIRVTRIEQLVGIKDLPK